jgi:ketosteroid isomerase-like protein
MPRENVEIVRELYAGWSEGDFRVGLEHFADDLRFVVDGAVSPSPGEWRGIEGMRKAWRENLSGWEGYRTGEIEHLLDSGDRVVAFHRLHGRGKQSGVEVDSRVWAAVFTFRDGKIVRLQTTDARGALDAVGLAE